MGIGTGHRLYIRQTLKESQGIILILVISKTGTGYNNTLRVISKLFVQYIIILQHHYIHQSTDKGYTGKLHEQ